MGELFDVVAGDGPAWAFGASGLACQLIWPLMRTRSAILRVQFGIGAGYALHYALLGAWTGAGIACLGAAQTAAALFAGGRAPASRLALIFLPAVWIMCAATWSGAVSLLAMTACSLVMTGRLQADTVRLRLFLLAAAPFGAAYDVAVGALPALAGALVSAAIAAAALAHEIRTRKRLRTAFA
jgi:hypothetical protein